MYALIQRIWLVGGASKYFDEARRDHDLGPLREMTNEEVEAENTLANALEAGLSWQDAANQIFDEKDYIRRTAAAFDEDPEAVAYSLGHSDAKRRKVTFDDKEMERMLPGFATLQVDDLRRCFEYLHPQNQAPSGKLARDIDWLRTQVWWMQNHNGQVMTQRSDRQAWERHKNAAYKLYSNDSM